MSPLICPSCSSQLSAPPCPSCQKEPANPTPEPAPRAFPKRFGRFFADESSNLLSAFGAVFGGIGLVFGTALTAVGLLGLETEAYFLPIGIGIIVVFGGVGLLTFVLGSRARLSNHTVFRHGVPALAEITAAEDDTTLRHPVDGTRFARELRFTFATPTGTQHGAMTSFAQVLHTLSPGDVVWILHLPDTPERSLVYFDADAHDG